MATLQGKAVKNTYKQVLQIGANNIGVSAALQPVQDGGGINTALSLSTTAATVTGDLTITGDLIITGGGIQIQDLIDDTVASLIQNGTGITWAYNDTLRTLTPTITIATEDGGAQADYFQFNVNAAEASAVGKLKWNTTDGTMDIGLMGGNVVLQVGQEQVARVLNNSGSILTEAGYQAVKIASAQGQRLAVALAQANNEANSKDTLGLVTENIANNQEGFVTTSGLVREIDTTGELQSEIWIDGDTLYLSPNVPGGVTKVKPTAPQQTVIVGFVVYAHKIHGKIFVKVDNGYEITELHDVKITSVANNNILKYNSSLAVWENVAGTTTNISEGTNLYYTQARFDSAFAAKTTTDLAEGTNLYFTTARGDANFATNFATKTTTNLPEGTNLYFTNARSRNALSVTAGTGISYNSSTGNFELSAIPNASLVNDEITLNGHSLALGGSLSLTTSDIAEGTNLYWTDARFDSRFGTKTTTNLAEGTNLYYTQARFNSAFAAKSTTDLTEGTNLYYTDARARQAISESAVGLDYSNTSGVLSLTSGYSIPTDVKLGQYDTAYNRSIVSAAVTGTGTKTLTLTEQDANTITATWTDQGITTINGTANQIAANTVGNTTTVGFTNDVTFPNNVVVSGNLTINGTATYVNTQSISSKDPLFEVANDNNTTDAVDIGYYGRYYDSAQTRVEFTGLFRDASDAGKFKFFTGLVDEPTNVVDTTGTGYTVGTLVANVEGNLAGTANAANVLSTARNISATGDAAWTVSFDGSADATAALTLANTGVTASTYGTTTAVPTIAIDSKGRITSASNTNIAFPVTTVNGASGTVVLTTSNVAEGTNQYFTSARAQAAISGTSPISVASGVVSITQSGIATNGYLSSTDWNTFNDKSPAAGSSSITTVGTIASGVWNGTSIDAAHGGTGIASYVVGDILYASGTTALSKLADVATGNALISGGVGVAPSWGKIDLTTHVSGILPIANGGTGSATQNFVDLTTAQSIGGAKTFTGQINANNPGSQIYIGGAGITTPGLMAISGSTLYIRDNATFTNGLSMNLSTGAATFSSSVTANSGFYLPSGGAGTSPTLAYNNSLSFGLSASGGNAGIYFGNMYNSDYSTSMQFRVVNSGGTNVTAMTLTPSGNVGIGTSSPVNSKVHISKASSETAPNEQIRMQSTGGAVPSTWRFDVNAGNGSFAITDNSVGERLYITSGGNVGIGTSSPSANLHVKASSGSAIFRIEDGGGNAVGRIQANAGDGSINFFEQSGYSLTFGTSNTERMRITSDGNVGINGTPASNFKFYIKGVDATSSNFGIVVADGSNVTNMYIMNNGTGYLRASSWVYGSDLRMKENISNLENGLDMVLKMKPKHFDYIDGVKNNIGFIAQDIQEIIPDAVSITNEETGMLGLKTDFLVPYLVKAIQEQQSQIEELKALIAAK